VTKRLMSRAGTQRSGQVLQLGDILRAGRACLFIIRPWAGLSLAAAVVAAYWATTGRFVLDERLVLVVGIIFLIASAAFPLNDVNDLVIDRMVHTERPLSRGELSPGGALILASGMIAVALLLAARLGFFAFGWALLFSLAVIFYSRVKGWNAFLGNVLAAALFGVAIPSVLFTGDGPFDLPLLFACAGLCTLVIYGREVVKDVEDSRADAANGRVSIPIRYGAAAAYKVSAVSVVVASAASIFIASGAGSWLRLAALAVTGMLLVMGGWLFLTSTESAAKARVAQLKIIVIVSILLLAVGSAA